MTRHKRSLDGQWDFLFDPNADLSFDQLNSAISAGQGWRSVTVPGPWQAQFDDLRDTSGIAWYRRTFDLSPDWRQGDDQSAILHFGAVDYFAEVWLNGTRLGSHEGGYLPFEFEVNHLLAETNVLLVRVTDPSDNPKKYPDFPFSEIPHGKQSW
jgi:beta-galactosidase/beta-glucuronidase